MSLFAKPKRFSRILAAVCASAILFVACPASHARQTEPQPERQPGTTAPRRDQPREGVKARPLAKEVLRKRLERRLSDVKDAQKKLEEALKAMEGGASNEDLRALLPEQGALRGLLDESDSPDGPPTRGVGDAKGPGEGGPGRFSGRDGEGRMGERRPLTDADREAIREILQSAAPEMAKKIDELMAKDPEAGKKKLNEIVPRMRAMLDMRERDPKMYKLRLEDLALARQSIPLAKELLDRRQKGESADSAECQAATKQLRGYISKQFENRMLGIGFEIEQLQSRIEDKRRERTKMQSEQSEAVERIMESLIKRADKPGLEKELFSPGRGGPGGERPGPGRPDDAPGGPTEKHGGHGPE